MLVEPCRIEDVLALTPKRFEDPRGYFCETYSERTIAAAGVRDRFVQDNQSRSVMQGTIRGLHFQIPPFAQAKLVRVLRGSIYDVAVDIRAGSPSFGQYAGCVLSAAKGNQFYVPAGFAHGFVTLEPDTEIFYKVSNFYSVAHDKGIVWDDPDIAIDWPLAGGAPLTSEKDAGLPRLRDLPAYFTFGTP